MESTAIVLGAAMPTMRADAVEARRMRMEVRTVAERIMDVALRLVVECAEALR